VNKDDKQSNLTFKDNGLIGFVFFGALLSGIWVAYEGFNFILFLQALLIVAPMGIVQAWINRATKDEYIQYIGFFILTYIFIFLLVVIIFRLLQSEDFLNFISLWKERISAVLEWIFVG